VGAGSSLGSRQSGGRVLIGGGDALAIDGGAGGEIVLTGGKTLAKQLVGPIATGGIVRVLGGDAMGGVVEAFMSMQVQAVF